VRADPNYTAVLYCSEKKYGYIQLKKENALDFPVYLLEQIL